jgi:hypothetical protein
VKALIASVSGPLQRLSYVEMSLGEAVAKHRQPADGLCLGRLVLEYVPMLGELAVFHAYDVGGNPRGGTAMAGEPAMRDYVIALGNDELVFVFQRVGQRVDQVEKPASAGCDVGAVLDVAIRPELLGGVVVETAYDVDEHCCNCGAPHNYKDRKSSWWWTCPDSFSASVRIGH